MNYRIRVTPRQLVAQELGSAPLSEAAVQKALKQVRSRGVVASYVPPPDTYGQRMVLIEESNPFAAIYRAMAPDGSPTPVPVGLVESRTQLPLSNYVTGAMLGMHGLAMLRVADRCVILCGTWLSMAHEANAIRYGQSSPMPTWVLVERACGIVLPPAQIDEDLRLRAAEVYDNHAMAVEGLLDDDLPDECTPVSHWCFGRSLVEDGESKPPF